VRGAEAIVLCADDRGATSIPTPNSAEVIRYGISSDDARLVGTGIETAGTGSRFDCYYDGKKLGDVELAVPGNHNVRNALAAIASGLAIGVELPQMREGLAAFTGVERRFQRIGESRGVIIIDDYAHHPTEIEATLQAARTAFPRKRIIAVFQPHLYSRTRDFYPEFAIALTKADVVFLCDLYPAREQPVQGVSSALIAGKMREAGKAPRWEGPRADAARALSDEVREGDVVITIGAGDITRTGPELLAVLEGKVSQRRWSSSRSLRHPDSRGGGDSSHFFCS